MQNDAVARGSGGLYGGILSAVLITQHGFSFAIAVSGIMAIVAGLVIIPLKFRPPVWKEAPSERIA
jgi:MFS transporter, OFA family, oxalate/formate antiporter